MLCFWVPMKSSSGYERLPPTARAVLAAGWISLRCERFRKARSRRWPTYASVPVINALTDLSHPCQVLADCLTLIEHKGDLKGLKIAFVGDGNNMVHSWMEAAEKLPIAFAVACPKGYEPNREIEERARKERRADHGDPIRRRGRYGRRRGLHGCLGQHGAGGRSCDATQSLSRLPGQ